MQKRYRNIQPSSSRAPPPVDAVPDTVKNDGDEESGKRKRVAGIACDNCRAKKVGCDGARPTCSRCGRLGIDCEYASAGPQETRTMALKRRIDELQQDLSEHVEILEHLKSMPERDVISVVRLLRSTPNASMVLSSLRGGAHTAAHPSKLKTSRALLTPTQSDTEFELNMLHSAAYPALSPLNFSSAHIDALFPTVSPAGSQMTGLPTSTQAIEGAFSDATQLAVSPLLPLRDACQRQTSPVAGPAPGRQYCDARLKQLKIAYWTSVPISDEFAACVLSHYLVSDHPIYACVDADLFLKDLLDRKLKHCSPFLVSALMSFACQSYTQFDKRSSAFSVAFLDEAQKMRHLEQSSQTINYLAAMAYLAIATGVNGEEELGASFAAECRQIAKKMNLIEVKATEELASTFHSLPLAELKSSAFAAWGTYAWLTFRGIYYPIEPIKSPPILPIPGDTQRLTDHGLFLLWPSHPVPVYMGQTFQTLSKLWVIIQEINGLYNLADKTPIAERISLSYAEGQFQGLLGWSHSLLPSMCQGEHSPSHVLFFHALYHSTVLNLFQPFKDNEQEFQLRSFTSSDARPSTIYATSLNQLKRLVYTHHMRKMHLPTTCWFNTAIMRLIAQANLAAALDSGALRSSTANALMEEIRAVGKHQTASDVALLSGLLDLERATKGMKGAQIDAMARRFDELVLFDDLTTVKAGGAP
ncbi:hypothetical protein PWT90_07883 [Aphanocladium album]|nr:hypothetical protein PWT90_07883 [Aphanocladium album]